MAEPALYGAVDYVVFAIMLCISLGIGIYFGFFGKRSNTAEHFLHGGRHMQLFPIGISLVASTISGSVLISYPSEIYSYGIMITLNNPMMLLVAFLVAYIYIPVYYKTGVLNAYEYLEKRFDWKVSKLASIFFIVYTYTYAPIISYLPALAFSQVTGANIHLVNTVVLIICIIYTMMGGIKAVIWTDVVQAAIMLVSCIAVVVYGIINVGGINVVLERSKAGGRLDFFDFNPSLTVRNSFWILLWATLASNSGHLAFNQVCVQRLIALRSLSKARRAVYISTIGYIVISLLTHISGLVIYATYYKCDPIKSKTISKGDKILPYFVMDTVGHLTGMPGIFVAAMFSASLSTLSAQMNSLAGIVYQDFFRKLQFLKHTEFQANLFMKSVVLLTGIYFILAGFIIDNFGHIVQMIATITGITLGLTTGLFTLGMLTPWANKHGAFYGGIISAIGILWIVIGSQIALMNKSLSYPPLPTSVDGCDNFIGNMTMSLNETLSTITKTPPDEPFILYKISFFLYSALGVVLVWVIGLIISFLTGPTDPRKMDIYVYATCIHWMLPKSVRRTKEDRNNDKNLVPLTAPLENDMD